MNKEERLRGLIERAKEFRHSVDSKGKFISDLDATIHLCEAVDAYEAALADPTPTRDPETCWHIFLIKQVGPLDGGPAKSTRYRCEQCGTFEVAAPYEVEVTIGPAK